MTEESQEHKQGHEIASAPSRDRWQKLVEERKIFIVINSALITLLAGSLVANQIMIGKSKEAVGLTRRGLISQLTFRLTGGSGGDAKLIGDLGQDAVKLVFMQGAPAVYGAELNVNFDQVQESMNVMKEYDPGYGSRKITLSGDQLQRYINVAGKISCEYCCGAASIIFQDGKAACGCAHSQAMRGLAAYLIQNHGSEYTDDQILRELARWKGRYFPKQMVQKMSDQLTSGQYTPDIASLILDMKLPKYSGSSGQAAPLPSDIKNLPGMVGGC